MSKIKKWKEKLQKKKEELQAQMQRGREKTEQMKAEKMRKAKSYKPGTFRYGLHHKQNPLDFMKDVKERRKNRSK
jgi:predicted nuclease with TOPRIM domain